MNNLAAAGLATAFLAGCSASSSDTIHSDKDPIPVVECSSVDVTRDPAGLHRYIFKAAWDMDSTPIAVDAIYNFHDGTTPVDIPAAKDLTHDYKTAGRYALTVAMRYKTAADKTWIVLPAQPACSYDTGKNGHHKKLKIK